MLNFVNCTRCHQPISEERQKSQPVICDGCGFVLNHGETAVDRKVQTGFLKVAVGFSAGLLLLFMQVASWGNSAFEVLPIQAKGLLGMQSPADMDRMAKICFELKKYECVQQMYAELSLYDQRNLLRLGELQVQLSQFKAASETYRRFFTGGGQDLEASYHFARSLSEIGQVEEALGHYELVLAAKPDVVQVTVMRRYLAALIDAGRMDQAKSVLEQLKKKDATALNYFDMEVKKIEERSQARS